MSINYRKVFELIEDEIKSNKSFNRKDQDKIIELCKDIYMQEASIEGRSSSRTEKVRTSIEYTSLLLLSEG